MSDMKPPLGQTMDTLKSAPEPAPAKSPAKAKPPEGKNVATIKFGNPGSIKVGQLFNTYRLGDKWADAVQKGDTVALANTEGEAFGTAEVVSVHSGQWDGVRQFAGDNHEVGHFPQAEAEALLHDNLRRYYPDDLKSNSRFAVLYLHRVD